MKQSFLEQVSQCQTKTPPEFFLPCNLMGISFPHTLDRNQRYAYWFPLPWSQRDAFLSLAFTAYCEFSVFPAEPLCQKGALNDTTTKRNGHETRTPSNHPPDRYRVFYHRKCSNTGRNEYFRIHENSNYGRKGKCTI